MVRALCLLFVCLLAGCALPPPPLPPEQEAQVRAEADRAAANFVYVVERVEPVAEDECRRRAPQLDCDLRIVVDSRPGLPPNAFQFADRRGHPYIVFTIALVADVRNRDELAFILGHEASHHIEGHLARTEASAALGAEVLGSLAQAAGQSPAQVRRAAEIGAAVGARTFSKEFELEADALGTLIAARAGFDPVRGALFFTRIPDPGDQFLGTHPPNAERMEIVRRVAAGLR